jgi:hypothetical protein
VLMESRPRLSKEAFALRSSGFNSKSLTIIFCSLSSVVIPYPQVLYRLGLYQAHATSSKAP